MLLAILCKSVLLKRKYKALNPDKIKEGIVNIRVYIHKVKESIDFKVDEF